MVLMSNTHTKFGRANLNPSEWRTLGLMYQGPNDDEARSFGPEHAAVQHELDKLGKDWMTDVLTHANGGCASCGQSFFYGAVVHNDSTGDTISIGGICLGVFELDGRIALAKRNAKAAAERGAKRRAGEEFAAAHEGLTEALETEHYIVENIRTNLYKWGSISQKQIDLVFKIQREEAAYAVKVADREAKVADAPALPEGRYTITGTLISTKAVVNQYSYYGEATIKMLVELDDGNRVYGTMPSALYADNGDRVQFDAAVTRSGDDEHFGWYKRPTKSVNLTEWTERQLAEQAAKETV